MKWLFLISEDELALLPPAVFLSPICLHWSLAHLGLSSGLTGTALEVALFPSCLRKFRFNSEALESLCQADFIVGLRMVTGLFWRPLSLQLFFPEKHLLG